MIKLYDHHKVEDMNSRAEKQSHPQIPALLLRTAKVEKTSQELDRVPLFVPPKLALNESEYEQYLADCEAFELFLREHGAQNSDGMTYRMAIDAESLMDRRLPNDDNMMARTMRRQGVPLHIKKQKHSHERNALLEPYNWTHLPGDVDDTFRERLQRLQAEDRARELFNPTSLLVDRFKDDLTLFDVFFVEAAQRRVLKPKPAVDVARSEFMREMIFKSDYVYLHPTNDAAIFAVVVSSSEEANMHGLPWPPPDGDARYVYVLRCLTAGLPDDGRSLLVHVALLAFMLHTNKVLFSMDAAHVCDVYKDQGARFVDGKFRQVDAADWVLREPQVLPLTRDDIETRRLLR